jgi:5-methylcytosine-specific restriction protein A
MPVRLCLEPRCPKPAHYRGRCPTHARTRNHHTHHHRAIYNSKRWQTLRRHILHHQPLCTHCGAIATDVDHIIPITQGGPIWAKANLQPLCNPCHSHKTRHEQQATP